MFVQRRPPRTSSRISSRIHFRIPPPHGLFPTPFPAHPFPEPEQSKNQTWNARRVWEGRGGNHNVTGGSTRCGKRRCVLPTPVSLLKHPFPESLQSDNPIFRVQVSDRCSGKKTAFPCSGTTAFAFEWESLVIVRIRSKCGSIPVSRLSVICAA